MKTILFLSTFLLANLTFGQQDKIDYIKTEISPYKTLSYGAFYKFLALSCPDRSIEYISGFDYEWGYTYELSVKRIKLAQPMEDVGDTEYEFVQLISKKPVPDSTTFKVHLEGIQSLSPHPNEKGTFTFNQDGTCTYLGEMTFFFDPTFKARLEEINASERSVKGKFQFLNNGEIHLVSLGNSPSKK